MSSPGAIYCRLQRRPVLSTTGIKRGDFVSIWRITVLNGSVDLATQTLGGRSVGIYQTNPADEVRFIVNIAIPSAFL